MGWQKSDTTERMSTRALNFQLSTGIAFRLDEPSLDTDGNGDVHS